MEAIKIVNQYLNELESYPIKNVLDLGCGDGRFSLRLAKKDTIIEGVDIKERSITNSNFNFLKGRVEEFKFTKSYDLIILAFILHFFKKDLALDIIQKVKENTRIGGFNLLVCISKNDDIFSENSANFYSETSELNQLYREWEIIRLVQADTAIEQHNFLPPHKHNVIILLAKKIK